MTHTVVDDLWHWFRPYKHSQQAANHGNCASLSADSWSANTSQLATLLHWQGGTVAVTMILSTCWVVEMPNVAQCCSIWDHGDWVHVNTESRENYNFCSRLSTPTSKTRTGASTSSYLPRQHLHLMQGNTLFNLCWKSGKRDMRRMIFWFFVLLFPPPLDDLVS